MRIFVVGGSGFFVCLFGFWWFFCGGGFFDVVVALFCFVLFSFQKRVLFLVHPKYPKLKIFKQHNNGFGVINFLEYQ